MICITKLNGKELLLNSDLIESIESLPDTTITLTNAKKIIAKESMDEVVAKIVEFKRKIYCLEY